MGIKEKLGSFRIMGSLFKFLWKRKLWWLMPFIAILLVFGLIIVLAQSTGVAPFIYALF